VASTNGRGRAGRGAADRDFAHTGPGTLAGRYLRRFWLPVYRAEDLRPGRAVPLRIMGQDFTLYRGEGGAPHVLDPRCAHRATQLSTGWVEGDCLRCFYHGWKYDASGQCVEQPAEDAAFARKVRIASYPTEEYLGLIFAYLGEGDAPPLPRYADFEREGIVDAGVNLLPYNYFNHVENYVDPVHVAFVHRNSEYRWLSGCPSVSAEETEYGMLVQAARPNGGVRLTHFLMPTSLRLKVAPRTPESGWRDMLLWQVPVDDEHHLSCFTVLAQVTGEAAERYRAQQDWLVAGTSGFELAEAVLAGKLHIDDVEARTNLINLQDFVAQRGQGVIADREHERLGRSDAAIILLRQIWSRELRALAANQPLKQWRTPEQVHTTIGV
jgi:5,5'-dehydrodivanillate O-demethylase oxygenase subunit